MRWALLLIAVGGCNQVFGLSPTRALDAPAPLPDMDGDGVPDLGDNCPTVANADQADFDGDGAGDVCDTCPALVNQQTDDFDGDRVGDDCDPHPTTSGDCLLLFDTFRDQASFDAHWTIVHDPADTPDVHVAAPQQLVLTPHGYPIGALSNDVAKADADGVIVVGEQSPFASAPSVVRDHVAGALEQNGIATGYACWLTDETGIKLEVEGSAIAPATTLVVGPVVHPRYALREALDRASNTGTLLCRIDWSLAVAADGINNFTPDPGYSGSAGVLAATTPATIAAIAIYGRPSTCPAPIIR